MSPRLLLDTHVLIRWLVEPKKLSREQIRVLERAVKRMEPVALSAISLLEIAILSGDGRLVLTEGLDEFLGSVRDNSLFQILPLTCEVAAEAASLGSLRDPADRTIVATARVHRMHLVTSDQRIIQSRLVGSIE